MRTLPITPKLARGVIATITFILALDPLFKFLPVWLSILLGLLTISAFLYLYLPGVLGPLYGAFSNSLSIKLAAAVYGCAGYLFASFGGFIEEQLFATLCVIGLLVLSVIWSRSYAQFSSEEQRFEFWASLGGKREAIDEYRGIEMMPKSKLRAMYILLWKYLPGVGLLFVLIVIFILVYILQFASVLFAFLLATLFALSIFWSIKRKRITPIAKVTGVQFSDRLYRSFLDTKLFLSLKGWSSIPCIILGILVSCCWAYVCFSFYFNTLEPSQLGIQPSNLIPLSYSLWILIFLPSAAYQLNSWYVILRRYPQFIKNWKQIQSTSTGVPALPKGGYIAFLLSCFSPIHIFVYKFVSNDSIIKYLIFSGSLALAALYIFLLTSSIRRSTQDTSPSNIRRDNLRIPLSTFSGAVGILVFWILSSYIADTLDITNVFPTLISATLLICIWFYDSDIVRYVDNQLGSSLAGIVLRSLTSIVMTLPFLMTVFCETDPQLQKAAYIILGIGFVATLSMIVFNLAKRSALSRSADR